MLSPHGNKMLEAGPHVTSWHSCLLEKETWRQSVASVLSGRGWVSATSCSIFSGHLTTARKDKKMSSKAIWSAMTNHSQSESTPWGWTRHCSEAVKKGDNGWVDHPGSAPSSPDASFRDLRSPACGCVLCVSCIHVAHEAFGLESAGSALSLHTNAPSRSPSQWLGQMGHQLWLLCPADPSAMSLPPEYLWVDLGGLDKCHPPPPALWSLHSLVKESNSPWASMGRLPRGKWEIMSLSHDVHQEMPCFPRTEGERNSVPSPFLKMNHCLFKSSLLKAEALLIGIWKNKSCRNTLTYFTGGDERGLIPRGRNGQEEHSGYSERVDKAASCSRSGF